MQINRPLSAAATLAAAEPLQLFVTHNGTQGYRLESQHKKGIEEILRPFLERMNATGSWQAQTTSSKAVLQRKAMERSSVFVSRPVNLRQVNIVVCTADGHLREAFLSTNTMNADGIVSLVTRHFGPKRLFTPEAPKAVEKPKMFALPDANQSETPSGPPPEPPVSDDNVALFLVAIDSEDGNILINQAKQEVVGIGGVNLIFHCLTHGLIEANGTAAYSITPKGKEIAEQSSKLPTESPEELPKESVESPRTELDLEAMREKVRQAREVLARADAIKAELDKLRYLRTKKEDERPELNQVLATAQEVVANTKKLLAKNRRDVLAIDNDIRAKEEDLNSPDLVAARETVDSFDAFKASVAGI